MQKEKTLTERMYNTGDYLVHSSGGGYFWANANVNGCLIEGANSDDVQILQRLAREGKGGVKYERKIITLC